MKKLIVTLALVLSSSSAFAGGFADDCQRALLNHSENVPTSMFEQCQEANQYTAPAIEAFFARFNSLNGATLGTILNISHKGQADCADNVLKSLDRVSALILQEACSIPSAF